MKQIMMNLLLLIVTGTASAQTGKDVNVDYMLRGYIYAQSSIEDTLSPGGFGGSDNMALKIAGPAEFSEAGLFLKLDTAKHSLIDSIYNAYAFYIVNKSDSTVKLNASDSRLYVVAEAYIKNKWQPVEYLPGSWCGNSYHKIYLKSMEYWAFSVPKYAGTIKTKIRYRLTLSSGHDIYSNEVDAGINEGQLSRKEGHKAEGIMDPYED